MNPKDSLPEEIVTGEQKRWRRRPELDNGGAAYEFENGPTIGKATGRVTARFSSADWAQGSAWLKERGFHWRTLREDEEVLVSVEHADALKPLRSIREISSLPGCKGVQPEILLPKAHKRL